MDRQVATTQTTFERDCLRRSARLTLLALPHIVCVAAAAAAAAAAAVAVVCGHSCRACRVRVGWAACMTGLRPTGLSKSPLCGAVLLRLALVVDDSCGSEILVGPEVAAVGQTEEQLKEKGIKYKVGSFPFKASGRARASMDTDGFVKVLADETTDEILGVHMIGPRTADMIAEAVVAMEYKASAEDISRISHAHPTFTESLKEAALDATGKRALHI